MLYSLVCPEPHTSRGGQALACLRILRLHSYSPEPFKRETCFLPTPQKSPSLRLLENVTTPLLLSRTILTLKCVLNLQARPTSAFGREAEVANSYPTWVPASLNLSGACLSVLFLAPRTFLEFPVAKAPPTHTYSHRHSALFERFKSFLLSCLAAFQSLGVSATMERSLASDTWCRLKATSKRQC